MANIDTKIQSFLSGNRTEGTIPSILEWVSVLEFYWIPIGFALFFTISTMIMSGIHLYYVLAYISLPNLQTDLYWMVFLCPIICLGGTIGMLIPRSAAFLYSIGTVYFLVCVFILVTLMTTLHGSRAAMCDKLMEKNVKLNPRVSPYACCFVCLKDIQPTARNFRIIEWFVFQSPVIRIVVEILNLVVYYELKTKNNVFFQITDVVSFLSLLVASYGSYILIPAGSKMLTHYRFLALFRILDWTQFIYSLQMTISTYLVRFGFYTSYKVLPQTAHSQFWLCFLATLESAVASGLTTFFLRPSKTALFDKYPREEKIVTATSNPDAVVLSPFYRKPMLGKDDITSPGELEAVPFIPENEVANNKLSAEAKTPSNRNEGEKPDPNKRTAEVDVEPEKIDPGPKQSPASFPDEPVQTPSSQKSAMTAKSAFSMEIIPEPPTPTRATSTTTDNPDKAKDS